MKKALLAFINQPFLVAFVSLAIAGIVGGAVYQKNNASRAQADAVTIAQAPALSNASSSPRHMTLSFQMSGQVQSVFVQTGDPVRKGEALASLDPENTTGALTQAKAAFDAATAAYDKVVNGATGPAIDVAKAAVASAQSNLDKVTKQEDALVVNAQRKLYSDDLVAVSVDENRRGIVPTITGTYDGTQAGTYDLYFADVNDLINRKQVSFSGLESGVAEKSDVPQALGTQGLMIAFPDVEYIPTDRWTIDIPNRNGANYVSNVNAYNAAVETHDQTVAAAQATLAQAEASLELTASASRPEDVAAAAAQVESARGALQIAQAAYDSRILRAPADGVVTAVHVSFGENASANISAIELSLGTTSASSL